MKNSILLICSALLLAGSASLGAAPKVSKKSSPSESDRLYWCRMAYRIAHPVLDAMSRGELRATMPVEQHPGSNRDSVTHLEALGRTLCGIAPWLESGEGTGEEEAMRQELTSLAVRSLLQLTDPTAPDYLPFAGTDTQPLVDAAFLAQALLRAPTALWGALDIDAQQRLLGRFRESRAIRPWTNNWLLFSATIEALFMQVGEPVDMMRIDYAVIQHEQWYKGDGAYGDGQAFHWDYYNSFVIHPMMLDVVRVLHENNMISPSYHKDPKGYYALLLRRSQRYAAVLERLISPEGTFPPLGRSLPYRVGAFHLLGQMALLHNLPEEISPAQVRSALTAVIRRQMEAPGTFDANGWLTMGFYGHQPDMAEGYLSTGSMYLCSAGFLPLGLPATDEFWSTPAADWTQVRLWRGDNMYKDESIYE